MNPNKPMPPKIVQVGPPTMQARPVHAPQLLTSGTIVKRITLEEYNAQRRAESGQMHPVSLPHPMNLVPHQLLHQPPPASIQFAPARHVQFVNQNTSRVPIQMPPAPAPSFHRPSLPDTPPHQLHGTIIENLSRMSIAKYSDRNIHTAEAPEKPSLQGPKEAGTADARTPPSHSQVHPPKPESPSSLTFDEDTQSSQKSGPPNAPTSLFVGANIPVAVPVEMLKSSIIIEKHVANQPRSSTDFGEQRLTGSSPRPPVQQMQHQAALVKTEVVEMREKNQALAQFVASNQFQSPAKTISDPDAFPSRGPPDHVARDLQAANEQLRHHLGMQAQVIAQIEQENKRLKDKLVQNRQRMGELEESGARGPAREALVLSLRTQLAEQQAANRDLESDASDFERKYRQSLAENVNLKNELMRLRAESEELRQDLSQWKSRFQEAQSEAEGKSALEKKLELVSSQLSQEKAARESLSRAEAQKETEARLEDENSRLRSMVTDLNAENENFHKTLTQSASSFEKFSEKLKTQIAANEALENEKRQLEERVGHLAREVEALRQSGGRRASEGGGGAQAGAREAGPAEKISNLILEDLEVELEQNNAVSLTPHEFEQIQQDLAMMSEQLMLRDHKIQKLRIERFEAMMRLAFSLSEVERLRNRHIPF